MPDITIDKENNSDLVGIDKAGILTKCTDKCAPGCLIGEMWYTIKSNL